MGRKGGNKKMGKGKKGAAPMAPGSSPKPKGMKFDPEGGKGMVKGKGKGGMC